MHHWLVQTNTRMGLSPERRKWTSPPRRRYIYNVQKFRIIDWQNIVILHSAQKVMSE